MKSSISLGPDGDGEVKLSTESEEEAKEWLTSITDMLSKHKVADRKARIEAGENVSEEDTPKPAAGAVAGAGAGAGGAPPTRLNFPIMSPTRGTSSAAVTRGGRAVVPKAKPSAAAISAAAAAAKHETDEDEDDPNADDGDDVGSRGTGRLSGSTLPMQMPRSPLATSSSRLSPLFRPTHLKSVAQKAGNDKDDVDYEDEAVVFDLGKSPPRETSKTTTAATTAPPLAITAVGVAAPEYDANILGSPTGARSARAHSPPPSDLLSPTQVVPCSVSTISSPKMAARLSDPSLPPNSLVVVKGGRGGSRASSSAAADLDAEGPPTPSLVKADGEGEGEGVYQHVSTSTLPAQAVAAAAAPVESPGDAEARAKKEKKAVKALRRAVDEAVSTVLFEALEAATELGGGAVTNSEEYMEATAMALAFQEKAAKKTAKVTANANAAVANDVAVSDGAGAGAEAGVEGDDGEARAKKVKKAVKALRRAIDEGEAGVLGDALLAADALCAGDVITGSEEYREAQTLAAVMKEKAAKKAAKAAAAAAGAGAGADAPAAPADESLSPERTKKEKKAVKALRRAIDEVDAAGLAEAIETAALLGSDFVTVCLEHQEASDMLTALRDKAERKAAKAANAEVVSEDDAAARLKKEKKAVKALRRALDEADFAALDEAVTAAEALGIQGSVEYKEAVAALREKAERKAAKAAAKAAAGAAGDAASALAPGQE